MVHPLVVTSVLTWTLSTIISLIIDPSYYSELSWLELISYSIISNCILYVIIYIIVMTVYMIIRVLRKREEDDE